MGVLFGRAFFATARRICQAIGLSGTWNRWLAKRCFRNDLLKRIPRDGKRLFQVVGVPRSGTTLLGACLDNHPEVICLLEPHRSWLERRCFEFGQYSGVDVGENPIWTRPPSGLLELLCASVQEACVGFKETFLDGRHSSRASEAFIKRNVSEKCVDATVGIVRDPRDTWLSIGTRFGDKQTTLPDQAFVDTWNNFADWVQESGVFFVRYEDLASEPEKVLKEVTHHLGLEFDPQMLEVRLKKGGGDRRALKGALISASSVGRHRSELADDARRFIEDNCGPVMKKLGYDAGRTPQAPGLSGT